MLKRTPVIDTDYYKTTQPRMYAPDVEGIFSYAESRGGCYDTGVLFGPQGFVKEVLLTPVTKADVDYADMIISAMGVKFDRTAWDIIVNEYNGYAPFTIKAVKEGQKVPVKNAVVTVECTDPRLFSLVGYFETALLRHVWYGSTIASRVNQMRRNIDELYRQYADSSANADFAFLDFSARGVTGWDASCLGSAAFLTAFLGTDTISGVAYAYEYYGKELIGGSVAATEHSVMCSYGEENEKSSFGRLLSGTPDNGILSVVSDTWNIYRACEYWCDYAEEIETRGITLVVRPDSGDAMEVLPKMLDILAQSFTVKRNDKGLKIFTNLKILWGDGVDETNYLQLLGLMPKHGYGVEVLMLGSGGGLMQKVNRDTMKWAFKASAVLKKGTWVPIKKDPITDQGKKSKAGKLELIIDKVTGLFSTVDWSLSDQLGIRQLETIYYYDAKEGRGMLGRDQKMTEIRALAAN